MLCSSSVAHYGHKTLSRQYFLSIFIHQQLCGLKVMSEVWCSAGLSHGSDENRQLGMHQPRFFSPKHTQTFPKSKICEPVCAELITICVS